MTEPIVCKTNKEVAEVAGIPIEDQIRILEQVIQDKKDNVNPQPGENREVRRFRLKMLESKLKKLKQKRGR